MAEAVACLHNTKPPIIHRDITPGNVLIKNIDGEVHAMLTDFGFAKVYDYNIIKDQWFIEITTNH